MKTKHLFLGAGVAALTAAVMLAACSKDKSSSDQPVPAGKQAVSLYLTDDPGYFDHVYVDIQSVEVLVDTCKNSSFGQDRGNSRDSCKTWENLQINAGVYDLLTLRNGVDTLLAQGAVSEGKVKKIKIRLGTNNSLVKDSVTYPLTLPGGDSSSLIVLSLRGDEWEKYASGRCRLWLDFDVQRSIVQVRNNTFYLRPVLHWFIVNTTSAVQGEVTPRDAYAVISVYSGNDTAYALPGRDGGFKVRGLQSGTYNIFVNASNGYKDTTISSVTLKAGKTTNLGKIRLHK
jgi:major membrane immunogen (membrane-anchored lipoprotein)